MSSLVSTLSLDSIELAEIDAYCSTESDVFKERIDATLKNYASLVDIRLHALRDILKRSKRFDVEVALPTGNLAQGHADWKVWLRIRRERTKPVPLDEASFLDMIGMNEVCTQEASESTESKTNDILPSTRQVAFRTEYQKLMPVFDVNHKSFKAFCKSQLEFADFEQTLYETGIITIDDIKRAQTPVYRQ